MHRHRALKLEDGHLVSAPALCIRVPCAATVRANNGACVGSRVACPGQVLDTQLQLEAARPLKRTGLVLALPLHGIWQSDSGSSTLHLAPSSGPCWQKHWLANSAPPTVKLAFIR